MPQIKARPEEVRLLKVAPGEVSAISPGEQSPEPPGFLRKAYEYSPLGVLSLLPEITAALRERPLLRGGPRLMRRLVDEPQVEAGRKAIEAYREGRPIEAAARSTLAAVPFFGPMATSAVEDISSMAGRGEVRGLVGAATGLATTMGTGMLAPRLAAPLKRSAARNYLSILLPSSKRFVPKAEQIAAGLGEKRPLALTRGQFIRRAAAEKEATGPAAGAAYRDKASIPNEKVQQIFDTLDQLEQRHSAIKGTAISVNEPLLGAIEGIRDTLRGMQDDIGNIAAETLDDYRDKLFRGVVDATHNVRQSAPATAAAIEKGAASSIKRVLESEHPSAKMLTDNYHLWSKTLDFLEDARRRTVAAKSGIITGSSQGFGALVQRTLPRPVRSIPNEITGLFDSVAWNMVPIGMKSLLANLIARSNWKTTGSLLLTLSRSAPKGGSSKPNEEPE